MRGPCFIAVSMRVEIEGRLNPRMAQDALHRFRLDLGGVYQQGAERVTQVVKPEPLCRLNRDASCDCCGSQVISNEYRSRERGTPTPAERRENEIRG